MLDKFAVASETCITAVKDWRVLRRVSVLWPVPVRLVALVAAFFAESFLVRVDEPAVPGWEDAGEVDVESLLNVDDGEVVEPGSSSRRDICWGSGWEALEAEDCVHVVQSLVTGEGAVFSSDGEILERAFRFVVSGVQLNFALFHCRQAVRISGRSEVRHSRLVGPRNVQCVSQEGPAKLCKDKV